MTKSATLRRTVEQVLEAYIRMIELQYGTSAISSQTLREAVQAFAVSPAFSTSVEAVRASAELELLQRKRGNAFHRLLCHPLTESFVAGELSCDMLPNYFSFLQLVLGDTAANQATRCGEIWSELRKDAGGGFPWDDFYDDSRAKQIFWHVLSRIAETFRRFDARRDWFITLMQNRPQALSLSSNTFLPRQGEDESSPFGAEEFNILFACLFGPIRRLDDADLAAFKKQFGVPPDKFFAQLFAELTACGAQI